MKSAHSIKLLAALVAVAAIAPLAWGQQGAAQRAGQALDNAGKNVRRGVENAVARGRAAVQEQDLLDRVYSRIHWDKALVGSAIELEVRADGTAILRGPVTSAAAKERALDLVESTVGVTTIVNELVIGKEVQVIETAPATTTTTTTTVKPKRVIITPPVAEPRGAKVIVKP
ncbi:BON domain-containing protein [Isosphaeraceae bacterium EP7]